MRQGNLSGHDGVVIRDVGMRVTGAVFELDIRSVEPTNVDALFRQARLAMRRAAGRKVSGGQTTTSGPSGPARSMSEDNFSPLCTV